MVSFLDSVLNMKDHISSVCRSSIYQFWNICAIHKYYSNKAYVLLIHAFVTARIDHCNSLLATLTHLHYARLQTVQNIAAWILSLSWKYHHISPFLITLQWLFIPLRIGYKLLLLILKCINVCGLPYLKELPVINNLTRYLRFSSTNLLQPTLAKLITYRNRAHQGTSWICMGTLWKH